jgi:hypothetical protein
MTDFAGSFMEIGRRIKKRSMMILFSDLLEDFDSLIKSLKYFPYLKNDLIVFQILDPEEILLTESGQVEYTDMETGIKIYTRPDVIRKEYNKKIKNFIETIKKTLHSHKIDYYLVTTDMTLDKTLSIFMEGRRRVLP